MKSCAGCEGGVDETRIRAGGDSPKDLAAASALAVAPAGPSSESGSEPDYERGTTVTPSTPFESGPSQHLFPGGRSDLQVCLRPGSSSGETRTP